MKARIGLMLTALAAVAVAAFLVIPSFFPVRDLVFEKGRGLPKDRSILVKTKMKASGVHKGDAFPYFVEIWYDPGQVSEIDRTGLDKAVNLKPFEIRDTKEREFDVDQRTRVYQREYEIQLIDGKVDTVYKFPTIVARYKAKDSDGLLEKTAVPEPVYVAPRLPQDIKGLELRPITEKIQDGNQAHLPWILWALGGFLALLGMIDLAWRAIPQWKESRKQKRTAEGVEVLSEAYRALCGNVAKDVEPKRLLHQMDHILRIVLTRKEKVNWLDGFNIDGVDSQIRTLVSSFFEKCQKAYRPGVVDENEKEEALSQLEKILDFYFGRREVEAWRN